MFVFGIVPRETCLPLGGLRHSFHHRLRAAISHSNLKSRPLLFSRHISSDLKSKHHQEALKHFQEDRSGMNIAVEGCCHGELDRIYASIDNASKIRNIKIDLVIICGDFQAMRNPADLHSFSAPEKYHAMGDFYKYYKGIKEAPYLTIVIGGNHEASSYLMELPYGGWLAPNIYYLGYAGLVNISGLRIGGLSGIFKPHDYFKPRQVKIPFDNDMKKSFYHVRQPDVLRLRQVVQPVDIGLSHDWPKGIEEYGDMAWLLKEKPFLRDDINSKRLGSVPAMGLLKRWKPRYWFSGHMHVKFPAIVKHSKYPEEKTPETSEILKEKLLGTKSANDKTLDEKPLDAKNPDEIEIDLEEKQSNFEEKPLNAKNPDEIEIDLEQDEKVKPITQEERKAEEISNDPSSPSKKTERLSLNDVSHNVVSDGDELKDNSNPDEKIKTEQEKKPKTRYRRYSTTRFLALSKVKAKEDYLQIVSVPVRHGWNSSNGKTPVLRYDQEWLSILRAFHNGPPSDHGNVLELGQAPEVKDAKMWITTNVPYEMLNIKENKFVKTAPAWGEEGDKEVREYVNPQTTQLLSLLGVGDDLLSTYRVRAHPSNLMNNSSNNSSNDKVGNNE